jgi:hypothetical protein
MNMLAQINEPVSETPPSEPEEPVTNVGKLEIRVKGQPVVVPSVRIEGRDVITSGGLLRVAVIHDEELAEGELITDLASFIDRLKGSGLGADILTFAQKLHEPEPRHKSYFEWDNLAVIPVKTYSNWLEKQVDTGVRRAIKKSVKEGISVRQVEFDAAFVEGIVKINNESPIRQGRRFWHYQKSFESMWEENSTYAERNVFLGAYLQGELIGYMRITLVDTTASIIQILSMMKHYDKRPANALVAKAVEVCAERGFHHLTYCNYTYNDAENSLTEFKRRNGFEKVLVPRYYIPLTAKGKLALKLGLHKGLKQSLPKPVRAQFLKLRARWYARAAKNAESN